MSSTNTTGESPQTGNALLNSRNNQSVGEYARDYLRRLASGDLGSLPIIIGLIAIAFIFQSQNSNFLTSRNFVNLILQMSGITMMAYGVVFVLLLGEIDLSIGYVSGVGGVAISLLLREPNVMGLIADGMPETLPFQAQLFLWIRTWGIIFLPLVLGGIRLIWYFYFDRGDSEELRKSIIQAVGLAVVSILFALLFRFTDGWTWYTAIITGILMTAGIGLLQGAIITFFQVPSFIVTLAGLLAWNGVVLRMIAGSGTVIIQDDVVRGVAGEFLPIIWQAETGLNLFGYELGRLAFSWGFIVVIGFISMFAVTQIINYRSRRSNGLSTRPIPIIIFQILIITFIGLTLTHVVDQDRGFPVVGLILLVGLVFLTFVAKNTQFGRFVYAVGGNAEAARRAGINVTRIRIIVFMMSSILAGFGGLILASRLGSVATNAGGGNILLNAIAAAVIGGTSLFGGRGHVTSAVLGALIIASVENGMGLLNVSSGDKFVITGIVLLVAVIVDALSRRRQQQSGIA